jgi:hypothetical protein
LEEAMDVLQRQVDEYENEIRSLKDAKTPQRGIGNKRASRRSLSSPGAEAVGMGRAPAEDQAGQYSLEATIFRPALQKALCEVAYWKSTATATAFLSMPPLEAITSWSSGSGTSKDDESKTDDADSTHTALVQLQSAVSNYRLVKSSVTLVDLSRKDKSPRDQLREMYAKDRAATARLEEVVYKCRGTLYAGL